MDAGLLSNLWFGLQTAGTLHNLFYCLIGAVLGTAIGVLPGLGPVPTIAMLMPITFGLPPVSSLIMLAGLVANNPVFAQVALQNEKIVTLPQVKAITAETETPRVEWIDRQALQDAGIESWTDFSR